MADTQTANVTVCEYCGPNCYGGAAHNARVEDRFKWSEGMPAAAPPVAMSTPTEPVEHPRADCEGCGDQNCPCNLPDAEPVADVPSGDAALPWLPQPDSEGWWWHKLGPHVKALEVTTLLPAEGDEPGVLYVSALGNYADYCGGLWQKVADPK